MDEQELEATGERITEVAKAIFAALNAGDFGLPEGITGQAYALGKSLELFGEIAGPQMAHMLTNKILTAIAWHSKAHAPSVQ